MARERATDTTALVAAAAEAFRSKGYRNATIDDIAEAAGISRPTVYKYTRSKQRLLDLMVEQVTTDLGVRLEQILKSGEPAPARLHEVIRAHIDAAIGHRTFYAIIFSEEVEISDEARTLFQKWARQRNHEFQALLDECLALQREPAPIDTHVAANLVLSMLNSVYRWYEPGGEVTPEQLTDQITILLKGLFPER
ncbi:TetR/AcrR family transcriptional regulator [Nocardia vaccinii]|uniref:TetR/AcrR family transcriptional regulator n=1 Tax=Nocardia vaccinii TaxID=1822 RepID=UPI0008366785|nr:TetR/AcrR family transcriptional regulator [Nocardia vaccinii]